MKRQIQKISNKQVVTRISKVVMMCVCVALCSCASVFEHSFRHGVNAEAQYCGTKDDYETITELGGESSKSGNTIFNKAFRMTLSVIDLPLSIIVDTIYWPFDYLSGPRYPSPSSPKPPADGKATGIK